MHLTGLWEELNRLGIRPATSGDGGDWSHATPTSSSAGVKWTPLDLSTDEELTEDMPESSDGPDAADPIAALDMTEDDETEIPSTEGSA